MALQPESIFNFCRLCAIESQSGVVIYSAEGESLCLEEKIVNCLRIEISRNDLLPKKVCESCRAQLEEYCRFAERAAEVQQTLGILLGMHMRHLQEQQQQDDLLLLADIKMESSLIKNELDELTVQQGSIQIDSDQQKLIAEDRVMLAASDDFTGAGGLCDPTARQIHRRKMLMPKKAASQGKLAVLSDIEQIECLMAESEVSHDFKPVEFNENDLFQHLDEEEVGGRKEEEVQRVKEEEEDQEDELLEKEWQKHFGVQCDECSSVFQHYVEFEKHYRINYNKKPVFMCSLCRKTLDKLSAYKIHVFRHINERRFKCRDCMKGFYLESLLHIHMVSQHSTQAVRSFICEQCGRDFATESKLDTHQKTHKTPGEYHCTQCGKVLQTRGGLTSHLTVHKLGRRFMCDLCGKTFTQKINMLQHVKHHKGDRPYPCDHCGKCFREKSHLNRHKSFHTLDRPFQCPVCKKMYKTERCLKVHSQVHLHTRPFKCTDCGKGFLSSTKLKQHLNCHTGERPYACKYCERTFTNYPNWLKHTRRRHKVDHKTGLSLKEEALGVGQEEGTVNDEQNQLEFVEMPHVKGEEVHLSQLPSLTQLQVQVSGYPQVEDHLLIL